MEFCAMLFLYIHVIWLFLFICSFISFFFFPCMLAANLRENMRKCLRKPQKIYEKLLSY